MVLFNPTSALGLINTALINVRSQDVLTLPHVQTALGTGIKYSPPHKWNEPQKFFEILSFHLMILKDYTQVFTTPLVAFLHVCKISVCPYIYVYST